MTKRWLPRSTTAISETRNAAGAATVAGETDRAVAYLLMRVTIGASLFGHGLVRLPKLGAFHAQLMGEFKTSILPAVLVSACSYALPFAEFVTGVLLLAGALTRATAVAGGLVMIVLVFGSTTIEHFNVIADQLVHASLLAAVIAFRSHNRYSVDHLLFSYRRSMFTASEHPGKSSS
jgi:thiosulfate dehydrogenase (quinone) large subunit